MHFDRQWNIMTKAFFVIFGFGVLGFIGVCGVMVSHCGRNMSGEAQIKAQSEADKFLQQMGIKGKAICAGTDTDGDGYISCPYVVEGKDGVQPLECGSGFINSEGCRPPKAIFTGR